MSISLSSNVQLPLPFTQFDNRSDGCDQPLTLNELRMNDLSNGLRNKPSWWTDLKDPGLRAQWTEEALQQNIRDGKLSPKDVEQVLNELEDYAKMRADPTGILPSSYAGIYESDQLVSDDLKAKLQEAVKKLENAPDMQKDWRVGSGGVVLDVVDPALFSAVYGRTLCWTTDPDGKRHLEPLTPPSRDNNLVERSYSTNFCWIPTDFQLGNIGEPAKALGYINNVHPEHGRDLVTVVEALVGRFSLLWDRLLTDLHPRNRQLLQGQRQKDASYSTQGRKLQVFVRVSGVHLTPENPEFPGGSWVVLGRANERIISAGIYYYDEDNVTDAKWEFRVPVSLGSSIRERNDAEGIKTTWGLEEGKGSNQVVGEMKGPTGRSVVYPNAYQFRVSPLKLIDPTRPGYRKLIGLILVDPENPIPSTTDIPPQQAHWPRTENEGDFRAPMTLEEAKMYRAQSTEEGRASLGKSLVTEVKTAIDDYVRENEDIAEERLDEQFKILFVGPLEKPHDHVHPILIIVDKCEYVPDVVRFVKLMDEYSSRYAISFHYCPAFKGVIAATEL
ncbi:hypothetical protein M407DRAFT_22357 [Tulasnella calospora MUT 4182]|uniref:Uncharacterized protein n=1 Tax=Tulasnella calospora MUT 4182 TaxID=1051891 RepID=A0A0C3M469_9AGAM|nr:hypothetical protein M407DRAFT_22357 [Tulasnella calospora MUT 4182]